MTDKLPDSIVSAQERAVKIKAERDAIEAAEAAAAGAKKARDAINDQKTRETEDKFIKVLLDRSPNSREALLEVIRRKREEPGVNITPKPAPFLTERMKEQLEREMAGGREAVAKHEARMQMTRDAQARMKAEDEAKLGQMQPVHRHNPSMDEKFPVVKGTIK